jgi:hypothetical protein
MEKISMRLISKVIVGAAVASACGYAAAATVTLQGSGQNPYSRAGAAAQAATAVSSVPVNLILQDGYAQFDTIRLSPVSASFATADTTGNHSAAFTCSGAAGNSVVFNLTAASSTASVLVYTAAAPVGTTTSGNSCSIASVGFRSTSLTTVGNVQIQSGSVKNVSAVTFDTGAAATVLSVIEEFSIGVSQTLNGVVDVASGRISFSSADNNALVGNVTSSSDIFAVSLNKVAAAQLSVSSGTMVLTLTAGTSFAYLQDPDGQAGAGSCSISAGSGTAGATATGIAGGTIVLSPNSGACSVLTATFNNVSAGLYNIVLGRSGSVTATNSSVFAPQSYTAAASATTGAVSLASLASGTAAGSWSLNGTTINIPYVPISSAINLQLFMSNRSSQTGNVTFTAWNASGVACTGTLGTINPTSQASFGSSLRAALQACTGTGWSDASRAIVQILSTTPSADTEVHSAFGTVDGVSRQVLINNTQGR